MFDDKYTQKSFIAVGICCFICVLVFSFFFIGINHHPIAEVLKVMDVLLCINGVMYLAALLYSLKNAVCVLIDKNGKITVRILRAFMIILANISIVLPILTVLFILLALSSQ